MEIQVDNIGETGEKQYEDDGDNSFLSDLIPKANVDDHRLLILLFFLIRVRHGAKLSRLVVFITA